VPEPTTHFEMRIGNDDPAIIKAATEAELLRELVRMFNRNARVTRSEMTYTLEDAMGSFYSRVFEVTTVSQPKTTDRRLYGGPKRDGE
jgi:hypothetical protein